ncbi:hypothetical protein [Bifidobacterium sp. SO1]|uniref:hypothetical protein n=1 Tax=Bifidobacterium sp. SO1 TaxID=2809029 RepID=UPI001BDD66F1|nr:hypothetical protein [Bifidobacterium sp. SO1]MBT1162883.1 hypothetical protein [Bifidobacterium sp. SO1]
MRTETYPGLDGMTCTHTYSEQGDSEYRNQWVYEHGLRRVVIDVIGSEKPSSWRTRGHAYAQWFENGESNGKLRSYNILGNAQLKAVRYVMGLSSDSAADRQLMELRQAKRREFEQRLGALYGNVLDRREVEDIAKYDLDIDMRDMDDEERISRYLRLLVSDPDVAEYQQCMARISELEQQLNRETKGMDLDAIQQHPAYKELQTVADRKGELRQSIIKRIGLALNEGDTHPC